MHTIFFFLTSFYAGNVHQDLPNVLQEKFPTFSKKEKFGKNMGISPHRPFSPFILFFAYKTGVKIAQNPSLLKMQMGICHLASPHF